MNHLHIADELNRNLEVFRGLFRGAGQEMYLWRPSPGKWCMLEVLCHLLDEEREDFRARVQQVLADPTAPLKPIDPQGWVEQRRYLHQNFEEVLEAFVAERKSSVQFLSTLRDPRWENEHVHPKLGPMSAWKFLANWLAHDYHHIRQVTTLKYLFWQEKTGEDLSYAGSW